MGPVAEEAVAGYLKDSDWTVRLEACNVLLDIGTKASVKALEAATKDSNGIVARIAKEALTTARGRPASGS